MSEPTHIPVLGFAAYSGTGKTTLLTRLIPLLCARGLRIGMIKHAHHEFDLDKPGKDSYELRKAGASQTLVASSRRWALVHENTEEREPRLAELIVYLDRGELDLILVEGFKHERYPKIELHRRSLEKPLLFLQDPNVIAVACDEELPSPPSLPVLNINDPEQIAEFVETDFLRRDQTHGRREPRERR